MSTRSILNPTPAFIGAHFGLPPSKAKTVAVIVRGGGRKVCSRERGLCEQTVKTHLRDVFQHTGTRTQAHLTAAVWRAWMATGC